MNDLDKLLEESLRAARDQYRSELSDDRVATKTRFMKRYRRRRYVFYSSAVAAAAGVSILAALFAVNLNDGSPERAAEPQEVASAPGGGVSLSMP